MSTIEQVEIDSITIDAEEVSEVTIDGVVVWESNSFDQFWRKTNNSYGNLEDWDAAVNNEFGSEWRVADWNDLQNAFATLSSEDWNAFTTYMWNGGGNIFCLNNGEKFYSGERAYFASYHGGDVPDYYAQHGSINNDEISLGSWYSTNRIMAIHNSWDASTY